MQFGTVRVRNEERVACLTTRSSGLLLPRSMGDLVAVIERGITGASDHSAQYEILTQSGLSSSRLSRWHRSGDFTGTFYAPGRIIGIISTKVRESAKARTLPKPEAPTFLRRPEESSGHLTISHSIRRSQLSRTTRLRLSLLSESPGAAFQRAERWSTCLAIAWRTMCHSEICNVATAASG